MIIRHLFVALIAALSLAGPAAAQSRAVAVTFDDLPYQATPAELCDHDTMLKLTRDFVLMLEPLDTHATLFINLGRFCERDRSAISVITAGWRYAGLEVGNHTFSHVNIHKVTVDAWLADVDAGAVESRLDPSRKYFRHPYLFTGETPEKKAAMAAGLAERGYTVAPVTIDNNDWMFAAVYRQAEKAGDRALMQRIGEAYVANMAEVLDFIGPYSAELTGGREPAQIVLLHANDLNRDWYPKIHALFLARGYRFAPLGEALKDPIYAHPDSWVRKNGVSWVHRWRFTDGLPLRHEPAPPDWITQAYDALD